MEIEFSLLHSLIFQGISMISQMENALGVCETKCKVKIEDKVLLGDIWLASQDVKIRVSLLYDQKHRRLVSQIWNLTLNTTHLIPLLAILRPVIHSLTF